MPNKAYKVSFCTTCKGRTHHLKETLPQNLANNADYPNTEFVILDYGSEDGLADWIKANYQKELDSGKIRYVRFEAEHFKMAHAKNMAHRTATGDILCNLDADNVTGKGFASWLNDTFSKDKDIYVRPHSHQLKIYRLMHGEKLKDGIMGRIAIHRDNFLKLKGYDETYVGWSPDDSNFAARARKEDVKRVKLPYKMLGDVIGHTQEDRVINLDAHTRQESERIMTARKDRSLNGRLKKLFAKKGHYGGDHEVNPGGEFGCGDVVINFTDAQSLKPVEMSRKTRDVPPVAYEVTYGDSWRQQVAGMSPDDPPFASSSRFF
ncbi:MAG: glycosyltransferase family A protein [Rickettsiales bacterium]|nr:glycosyltransferase family A protein [Rickettsiales bacterium]